VVPAEGEMIGRKPVNLIVGWCGTSFFHPENSHVKFRFSF